jgi:hypothetical protein
LFSAGKPFLPKFPIGFPNEPDNADPGEDCVTFHAEGKIRDVPCFYNLPFLCERELDVSWTTRDPDADFSYTPLSEHFD